MNFTKEEMQKIAWSVSSLRSVGGFLAEDMPKFFSGARGIGKSIGLTAANANKAGMIGAAVGGVGGAATTSSDDPNRGKSMLVRGAIGATAGFFGGKGLANKMPTFGKNYEAAFKPVGNKMLDLAKTKGITDTQRGQQLTDFAAGHLTPQYSKPGKNVTTKNFFNQGSKTKAVGQRTNKDLPWGAKVVGDIANTAKNVRTEGVIKGVGKTIQDNWNDAKYFDKQINAKGLKGEGKDPTYRFKRSAAGRIVNPLMTAGLGMGITEAAMPSEDGSKQTMSKRIGKGARSTLAWGMAPHLMVGKMVAHDIPKTFMGGNKQPQQDINNIGV